MHQHPLVVLQAAFNGQAAGFNQQAVDPLRIEAKGSTGLLEAFTRGIPIPIPEQDQHAQKGRQSRECSSETEIHV